MYLNMSYTTHVFAFFRFTAILDRFRITKRKRRIRVIRYIDAIKYIGTETPVRVAVTFRSLRWISEENGVHIHHPLTGDTYCEVGNVRFYAPNFDME